jgi:hypothetical protein
VLSPILEEPFAFPSETSSEDTKPSRSKSNTLERSVEWWPMGWNQRS